MRAVRWARWVRSVPLVACVSGCNLLYPLDGLINVGEPVEASHVSEDDAFAGNLDLELVDVTLDTDELTIDPPISISLLATPQATGGPELAVLRARALVFLGTIKVTGARPLVVLADSIEVAATLDVSADGPVAGPGGAVADGVGGNGIHTAGGSANGSDSGGGGGGFGSAGEHGGNTCLREITPDLEDPPTGGVGGVAFSTGTIEILQGGGAGGLGAQGGGNEAVCPRVARGGGGGGALQLSARFAIDIPGVIDASGGGGDGGVACMVETAGAGSGGGAGGAVFVEAPSITVSGTIVANGGGGGGGGGVTRADDTFSDGQPGRDGASGPAAVGGVGGGANTLNGGGTTGGSGGIEGVAPTAGASRCNGQTGGGGGGVGRVALRGQATLDDATISPTAFVFE